MAYLDCAILGQGDLNEACDGTFAPTMILKESIETSDDRHVSNRVRFVIVRLLMDVSLPISFIQVLVTSALYFHFDILAI